MRRDRLPRTAALSLAIAALVVAGGCGASSQSVKDPFAASKGEEGGPGSGLWGDGSSGPRGMQIGCIDGRRLAVLITVHNRTKTAITLLGAGGPQSFPRVIERVAVQVRLAPPPPKGDLAVIGLRTWRPSASVPVSIPPARDAWVQSNFLMKNCSLLRLIESLTVNRSTTLAYSIDSERRVQVVSVEAGQIILTRGPLHPSLPINQAG
jgi:hypothetical protein